MTSVKAGPQLQINEEYRIYLYTYISWNLEWTSKHGETNLYAKEIEKRWDMIKTRINEKQSKLIYLAIYIFFIFV